MKNIIRIDVDLLQELINVAAAEPGIPDKVLINIEDETGKIVKTQAVKICYDKDNGMYSVEWIP